MKVHLKVSALAIAVALLATAPASALSLNLGGNGSGGGLLGLGGSGSGGSTATVNTDTNGLLDNGSGTVTIGSNLLGGPNDNDATANLNLGGAGSGGVIDLLGNGSSGTPTTADVNLGGTSGTNGNVLLDLFGDGSSNPNARVDLGNSAVTGGSGSDAVLDLFGTGTGSGGSGTGTGTGTDGNSGVGIGTPGAATTGTVAIASLDGAAKGCFTPNANQVAKLASRHAYVESTFSSWAGVSQLKVVDIGLCRGAGTAITSQSNVGRLQAFVSDHAALRDGLGKLGHKPADVIAADRSGNVLTVYVM
ncbi:MAG: hypothetical protein ACTHNL_03920 [Devosia sp.]